MRLPEIPDSLADPTALSLGAPQGGLLLVTFLGHTRKVTRAKREMLYDSEAGQGLHRPQDPKLGSWVHAFANYDGKRKIKMDPSVRWDDGVVR